MIIFFHFIGDGKINIKEKLENKKDILYESVLDDSELIQLLDIQFYNDYEIIDNVETKSTTLLTKSIYLSTQTITKLIKFTHNLKLVEILQHFLEKRNNLNIIGSLYIIY
jgi:hypothetical protein